MAGIRSSVDDHAPYPTAYYTSKIIKVWELSCIYLVFMGDLQNPIDGGTNLVPYFCPYFVGISP